MQSGTTRRQFLAAGSAGAVFGHLRAVAGDSTPALTAAIERHRSAFAEFTAHQGPEDLPTDIGEAEHSAALDVARAPIANEAELWEKLRYLFEYERNLWGAPDGCGEFGLLAIALATHLGEPSA